MLLSSLAKRGKDTVHLAGFGRRFLSVRTTVSSVAGVDTDQSFTNITSTIAEKVGRNLHLQMGHPLNTIKTIIEGHFLENAPNAESYKFECVDDRVPIVTTRQCFDELLTPKDHVSRNKSDTYYVSEDKVLRTHTSAHQTELMREGKRAFLCTGDVYRRDEIDSSHYPVFHQMEGVKIFDPKELPNPQSPTDAANVKYIENDLKDHLEGMVEALFGAGVETRWVDAYFPFTDPSLELEVFFRGDWLEVLGSGVIERKILTNCELGHTHGWAFGLGLERLAMVLFDIPDIRLFWTEDIRFSSQFRAGEVTTFKPYSKYPECYKDVSFWRPEDFHENDLCDMVRGVAGDLVEKVELIDQFRNEKVGKTSYCYRIVYRSMDRSLTNEEVDVLQNEIRDRMSDEMGCELR